MKDVKKLVMAALFAALCCVATMSIKIPVPATNGYIHPGDAMVILSGIFLGPVIGGLAAGIGSMMADLLGGYMVYVPITFAVKAVVAIASYYAFHLLTKKGAKLIIGCIAAGICATIIVALGYFVCESFLYGIAAAAGSVIPNIVQGLGGLIISSILLPVLSPIPEIKKLLA